MKSILIADPDPAARKALRLILKHRFALEYVQEVADLAGLICALAGSTPDVLLLDRVLYGAPAPETCRLLHKAYPALQIILCSADAQDASQAELAQAAFIHKGAAPAEMIACLSPLLKE